MIMMKFQPAVKFRRPLLAGFPANWLGETSKTMPETPKFRRHPLVNIVESRKYFRIELAAPGMEKDKFQIQLEGDLLTISAKKQESENGHKTPEYSRHEFDYANFSRSFRLGEMVDSQSISAGYEGGILTVVLMKKPESQKAEPRAIEIA